MEAAAIRYEPRQAPVPGPTNGTYESPNWVPPLVLGTPANVYLAAAAYDPVRDQTVLFGGCQSATSVCGNATTVVNSDSNNSVWATASPATSPPARYAASMVWDPAINKIVLFGGVTSSGSRLSDTWTWDGTTWAQWTQSGAGPSARSHVSLAYDPDRSGIVLFGGRTGTSTLAGNDTWVFGTSGWTQILSSGASGAPTYRADASLAYSGTGTGGQLVLFGGSSCSSTTCSSPSIVGDTWTLGSSGGWVQQSPTQSPPATTAAALQYDSGLDALVMFGGLTASSTATNATWAWTGTTWLKAADGISAPSARYYMQSVAKDNGQLVVIGGVIPSASSAATLDFWVYDTNVPVLGINVSNIQNSTGNFVVGDVVTVTVTAENTGLRNIVSGDATNISATLNGLGGPLLSAVGATVKFAGSQSDPIAACRTPIGDELTSTVGSLIPSVTRAPLNAGCSATATFLATVVGSPQGCALVDVFADALNLFGASARATTRIPVCGNGLGKEDWYSYDSTALGAGATADVNVANGNLVVKQTDSTPILSHGDLGFELGRAYNSQAPVSGNAGQASILGSGWQFDIGDTGAAASGLSIGSLIIPSANSVLQPLAVTYVDRDGTRFVFRPRTPSLDNISGSLLGMGNLLNLSSLTNLLQLGNLLGADLNSILASITGSNGSQPLLCADTTYVAPPGADFSLFRYVAIAGGGSGPDACHDASANGVSGVTVGYAVVRPDRVRYDFNLKGQLSDTVDGAGNTLMYTYDGDNRPSHIFNTSCYPAGITAPANVPNGAACPQYSFDYSKPAPEAHSRIDVTDPAGRVTTYIVSTANLNTGALPELEQVWNPDNPYDPSGTASETYTYSSISSRCPGSDATSSSLGLMCSATDPLGAKTTFAYTAAPVGPDRALSVTDRRANAATADAGPSRGNAVRYTYNAGYTTADSATPNTFGTNGAGCVNNATCERTRYASINSAGSVGEIDEGASDDTYTRQQAYYWDNGSDGSVLPCRQPDQVVDNNLCQTITRAKASAAAFVMDHPATATINGVPVADQATRYVYGDMGQVLSTQSIIDPARAWTDANSATTTYGAHDQYVQASGDIRAYDDVVTGSGNVNSITRATADYAATVNADNPAAFYRFNELSGATARDSSGHHQDAAFGGAVPLGLPGAVPGDTAVGNIGPNFTASVGAVSGFASGTGPSSAFTVEAWEKTATADIDYVACTPCTSSGMVVGRYNGVPWVYLASPSGGLINVVGSASIADGHWHQVDYTYSGNGSASGVTIYVDGKAVPTITYSDTLGTTAFSGANAPAYFGYSVTGNYNDGSALADVALYGSALSDTRVAAHRAAVTNLSRPDGATLYSITDQTAKLTPRGNQPSNVTTWGDYLTTYLRDVPSLTQGVATSGAATPNTPLTSNVCATGDKTNTGLLCATITPASADVAAGDCPTPNYADGQTPPTSANSARTCTTSTYNTHGEMLTSRSPNAHATGDTSTTNYTYYADTGTCTGSAAADCDLSGTVSAGGWLKAVTDPYGHSVVSAYDAAGNAARTWDRNATAGHALTENWTNPSTPPSTQYSETDMANPITAASLSAGTADVEIIRADGTVWGSGSNSQNELGNNTSSGAGTAASTPVRAAGIHGAVQVVQNGAGGAIGINYTAVRTNTGAVYSWGYNAAPALVTGLPPIISLAAGGAHFLALDNTGAVWAWGANSNGQIGNNSSGGTVSTPVKVLTGVSAVAAGAYDSYAVKTDGTVWAWGDNQYGELGNGTTTASSTPTKTSTLSNIASISSGQVTAYAIGTDGAVWSWGDNTTGALGTGTTASTSSTPQRLTTLGPGTGAGAVKQIVGSAYGAAALTYDGHVQAWGLNNVDQLGTSSGTNSANPIAVPGVSGQVALAGGFATYVSADRGGKLTIWGTTAAGQIGDGTTPNASTPTATAAVQTISPYTAPWRYARGKRDPVGNLSTMVTDPDGDTLQMTPGRGTAVTTTAYDTTATFNANNQTLAALTPAERDTRDSDGSLTGNAAPTQTTYDTFGNATVTTDPRSNATVTGYDTVNRPVQVQTTRSTTANSDGSGCSGSASTSNGFSSQQAGHVVCTVSTTYDGNDQTITATDALSQTATTTFDGLGRAVVKTTPRFDGTYTTLTTTTNYDVDGHPLDTCPPRQRAEGGADSCTSSGLYSTHNAYDAAGHVITITRYRAGDPTLTLRSSYAYDADGNQTRSTDANGHATTTSYDLLDRKTTMRTPRAGSTTELTTWQYDASGNVTAVIAPGSAAPGSGIDGALVVDGTTAANSTDNAAHPRSNPFQIPENAEYTSVTVQNGGWITGTAANGLTLTAATNVTLCNNCGVDEAGKGQPGGAGGAPVLGSYSNGSPGAANPGNGGGGGRASGAPGGGGGHKTAGTPGTGDTAGTAGAASGSASLTDVGTAYLRGSGGGGGGGASATLSSTGGKGGNGGGFVHLSANTLTINGTIDARGQAGTTTSDTAGPGGGGAGGSIWLSGDTVNLASGSTVSVAGGAGGTATFSGGGGAGASGYLRIDTNTGAAAGADSGGRVANITAYSYDADNRALDTLAGAQTTDATDTGTSGTPDTDGLANTRTRQVYDADGHVVAALPPQAFSANGVGQLRVDSDYATRTDFDLDGRTTASYDPRYNNTVTDTGASNDGGTGTNQQTTQCKTGTTTPDLAPGLNAYGTTVGVCIMRMTYDANGNTTTQRMPTSNGTDNRYLTRTYTDDNLVLTQTAPDPTGSGRVTTDTYRYDGDDRPLKDTDANGNTTTTTYTADGLTAETNGQCYNIGGSKDPNHQHDHDCVWSGGTTITHKTTYRYDADGNQTATTAPRAQDPSQSTAANLEAADFTTTTTWTSDGLKARIQAPGLGHGDFDTTTYIYDGVGNPKATTMPSGNAGTADANNPDRLSTTYTFTDDNLIATSSTPVTSTSFRNTIYSYNPAGQKTATSICTTNSRTTCPRDDNPDHAGDGHGVTRYVYGPNGLNTLQIAKATSTTPTTIRTAYDQAGRVKTVDDPTGGGTTITAGYYLDGQVRTVNDGTNANTYAYNGAGQVTNRTDKTASGGITDGNTKRTSYAYNDAGLATNMTSDVHAGDTTTVGYDAGGRMTTWIDNGGGTGQTRTYSYLADDTLASVNTRAAGDTSDRLDYAYTYDNDGNITSQIASGTAKSNYTNTYGYNPASNITTYSHTSGTNDPTATSNTSYTWDHNANRLTANTTSGNTTLNQSWHYRADNSISYDIIAGTGQTSVTRNYLFNQAGLLQSVTPSGSNTACTTNTYDDLDRIKRVFTGADLANCGVATGSTVDYAYDGLDRQRTATTSGSGDPTTTIYDGLTSTTTGQSKATASDNSKPTNLYQLTPDGRHIAVWQASTTNSAASLIDDDNNGNNSLLLDSSKSGTDATGCTISYDPFGAPARGKNQAPTDTSICSGGTNATSTSSATWYRDQRRDGVTGNYQLGTRTFNPASASFGSPDNYRVSSSSVDLSVEVDPLTANTYGYVNGNPLNLSDADGHTPCSRLPAEDRVRCEPAAGSGSNQSGEKAQCDGSITLLCSQLVNGPRKKTSDYQPPIFRGVLKGSQDRRQKARSQYVRQQQTLALGYEGGTACDPSAGPQVCILSQQSQKEGLDYLRFLGALAKNENPCEFDARCALSRFAGDISGVTGCRNGSALDCAGLLPAGALGRLKKGEEVVVNGVKFFRDADGALRIRSGLDKLTEGATAAERGHQSAAGKAYNKHALLEGSPENGTRRFLPTVRGSNGVVNTAGADLLDSILEDEFSRVVHIDGGRFAGGFKVFRSDGVHVVFDSNAKLQYFGH